MESVAIMHQIQSSLLELFIIYLDSGGTIFDLSLHHTMEKTEKKLLLKSNIAVISFTYLHWSSENLLTGSHVYATWCYLAGYVTNDKLIPWDLCAFDEHYPRKRIDLELLQSAIHRVATEDANELGNFLYTEINL